MYKIPNDNRNFLQTNQSDLKGNIWYSKNINFDEEGYLKLSPRAVSFLNDVDDTDFGLPVSFGRTTEGQFFIATSDNPYILNINEAGLGIVIDTDSGDDPAPGLSLASTNGLWWRNLWHVTNSTKLYYKTLSNGNWTDTGVSLTTGVAHPLCDFIKAGTLLIGNGNAIKQLDSSYTTTNLSQLTLSTDYEVIGIAYNNNQSAIATRLASTVEGQNKEAGLFIWDGSESSANNIYGVGSDACIAVAPYKSSFVVLNREGQLLYFNGGGFEQLASFPIYFKDYIWGSMSSKLSYGDNITVKGDVIYINIKSTVDNETSSDFEETFIGGIWCYDPKVGLYHKYSPSISKANGIDVSEINTDLTTNTLTTANNIPDTGNPIMVTLSNITPIYENTTYFIIKSSPTTFKLAETYEDAMALTPIDLTAVDGASYFVAINIKDYSQSRNNRGGGVAQYGSITKSYTDILFGGDLYTTSQSAPDYHINSIIPTFKNIGYFLTPKLYSSDVEDNIVKLFLKYRPLDTNDTIQVKYKNSEFVDIPEYATCTATSNTILTTTSNIAKSLAFTDEMECEVISGAGGGQMVKVSSITYDTGTYTIILNTALEGVSASDLMTIKLDNWTEIETVTSADTMGYKEIALAKTSKWAKFKIVLNGYNIAIEELQIINAKHI